MHLIIIINQIVKLKYDNKNSTLINLIYFKEYKCSSAIAFFQYYNFKNSKKVITHHI